jgi:hypothetical protein
MRRHLIRPYGQSISTMRALSLLMLLVLLWMMYGWIRNPAIWSWMARAEEGQQSIDVDEPTPATGDAPNPQIKAVEKIVPGRNDQDRESLKSRLELVTDKAPLRPGEMPIYWKLMEWSRTESFEGLKARAAFGVPFSKLWETPKQFRGDLVHLRLHVRRVLRYETDGDPLGVKTVYEAWGWTDDSKSFPYVVVFSERPEGLPIGTDVRADIEFVGYFLKIMSYTAFDVSRGAPLLIGRAKATVKPATTPSSSLTNFETGTITVIGVIVLAGVGWWQFPRRKVRAASVLPHEMELPDANGLEAAK